MTTKAAQNLSKILVYKVFSTRYNIQRVENTAGAPLRPGSNAGTAPEQDIRIMGIEFNRIITLLRKERGITQKQAAEDLGVSQALLSHYEKGIRECGLDFVVRVADYYNVSCDYLLGRSAERNGMMLNADDLPNPDKMKDNVYHGSVLPTMNKKLISNSLNVLYAKIAECHSKALTTEVSTYLMMAVAKMFRLLYSAEPHNAQSLFSVEARRWPGYSDAVMRMSESNVEDLLAGEDLNGAEGVKDPSCLAMTTESLTREYPLYTPSLLNLVKTSETHVRGLDPNQ